MNHLFNFLFHLVNRSFLSPQRETMSLHSKVFHGLDSWFLFITYCVHGQTFTWWTIFTLTWLFLLINRAWFLAALSWGALFTFNNDIWVNVQRLLDKSLFSWYLRIWCFGSHSYLRLERWTHGSIAFIVFLFVFNYDGWLFIQSFLVFFANISQCLKIFGLKSFCPNLIYFFSYVPLSCFSLLSGLHA